MKYLLRIALPPLHELHHASELAFVLIRQRDSALVREGRLPVSELMTAMPACTADIVLHPGDAIVASITLPVVSARHQDAAVQSSVEPMTLSDPSMLCIAYGPRGEDGITTVAWADRRRVADMWALLHAAGIAVQAIYPQELLTPQDGAALTLPADSRWLATSPTLSLARDELRPAAKLDQWKQAAAWLAFAAMTWTVGLQVYAAQLSAEAARLRTYMSTTVAQAFPDIPVILDPVKQAQDQRDALLAQQGAPQAGSFAPLALAAARTLDFASKQVRSLHFADGSLTLTLTDDAAGTPQADHAAPHVKDDRTDKTSASGSLQQAAAAHALIVQQDKNSPNVWHIRHQSVSSRDKPPS